MEGLERESGLEDQLEESNNKLEESNNKLRVCEAVIQRKDIELESLDSKLRELTALAMVPKEVRVRVRCRRR